MGFAPEEAMKERKKKKRKRNITCQNLTAEKRVDMGEFIDTLM